MPPASLDHAGPLPEELRTYAEARVPRYTSYPTAVQFHDGVTAADYAGWLADVGQDTPLSLYLHVPFCHQLCWYCGCHTNITRDTSRISSYASLLIREVALVRAAMIGQQHVGACKPGPVHHIHLGGGSPNALAPNDLLAVIGAIRENFMIASGAEIACELDPRHLTDCFMTALAGAGINRVSLGVQDLNPIIQARINRIQPFIEVAQAVYGLRRRGIEHINLDLMYGLPGQTVDHVLSTIDQALTLKPNRFAVFGYAHVPWFKKHQKMIETEEPNGGLPGTEERLAQAEAAREAITAAGYVEIGMDHYALPDDPMAHAWVRGNRQRNFQGFTTDDAGTLIGFGASSISCTDFGYAQNNPHVGDYRKAVEAGQLPVIRGTALSAEDRLRRRIISDIMCEKIINLAAICRQHGFPAGHFSNLRPALTQLADDGLILYSGAQLTLTKQGRRFSRNVAAIFDAYLDPTGTGKHSTAS